MDISSIDQVQNNLYHGFILFFLVTTLVVAYFHSHFKKRK